MIKQVIINSVYTDDGRKYYNNTPPRYATSGSAGMDLSSTKTVTIPPGETAIVPLGIHLCIEDPNYVGILAIRSGMASGRGLTLANSIGVIDSDFGAEVKALIYNTSKEEQTIHAGERVVQFLLMPVQQFTLGTKAFRTFQLTPRDGGFGSTGTY